MVILWFVTSKQNFLKVINEQKLYINILRYQYTYTNIDHK